MNTKGKYQRPSLMRLNRPGHTRAVALLLLLPIAAWAGGVVTNCTETALRAALTEGGLVTFACDGTITLGDSIVIGTNTVLDCSGHQVTISGGGSKRVFYVNTDSSFTAINLTIAHGVIPAFGGAIYNSGTVILHLCTLTNNSAGGAIADGGAIFNEGTLTADQTTLCGNTANGQRQ